MSGLETRVGVVAIGRNEGERLRLCLESIDQPGMTVVYVDSGSTDGSRAMAAAAGARVVELDMARPFTAARARNAGLSVLRDDCPTVDYVQFVDGDCQFEQGWLAAAVRFLDQNMRAAVVCGRRRERYPDASLYNRLADEEWNTPVGEARACGGDALMRLNAVATAGGYDPDLAAGEEPELCARLRAAGWSIWRIDQPMTIHDAAMHRFRQWWLRAVRSGMGYAQAWQTTRHTPVPLYRRELLRALGWTLGVLVLMLVAGLIDPWLMLLGPALWIAQYLRLTARSTAREAGLLLVGKAAETLGILRQASRAIRRRQGGTIFYK